MVLMLPTNYFDKFILINDTGVIRRSLVIASIMVSSIEVMKQPVSENINLTKPIKPFGVR